MLRGSGWRSAARIVGVMLLTVMGLGSAMASNPRWTTGNPYFWTRGNPVIWYTDQPLYFTDPGYLSASVDHAAADALVAAAAGVWNIPTARIVLQQGGTLNEHLDGTNVYMGASGLMFPADADSSNYAAKQIVVVYDTDGSVTDLLMGGGASNPVNCGQNAVTESVDDIEPSGYIQHAVLILNGRCTGPAPEQQLQMQYQLERAFGRVLGLGWSQANDNVFTGTPEPTYDQALHWPIMHPIDVVCGPYTYQCLPEPFTLRPDDLASITALYPVTSNPGPGKQLSSTQTTQISGTLLFPSQQGMGGVNVVVRRIDIYDQVPEAWDTVSQVSGSGNVELQGNPITPKPPGLAGSLGGINPSQYTAGYYNLPWIPLPRGYAGQVIVVRTEPVNPLYTGTYAVGSYQASTVNPSGSQAGFALYEEVNCCGFGSTNMPNAATACSVGGDGTENMPAAPPASGWATGVFCGNDNGNGSSLNHTSWFAVPVRAGRTLTVEATAEDESGLATPTKARPVIGIWNATDSTGTPPSVAVQPSAFNSVVTGMTTLAVQSTGGETFRIAIAEERGDGRPDYAYQARVMYADAIAPAISQAGARVTITGMGFRPGNVVTIGGVTATVSSWTATQIVATVPFLSSVTVGATVAEDVAVRDPSTQGTTVMTAALQYMYTVPSYKLVLVSGPTTDQPVSLAASPVFAVQAIESDGITPQAGTSVTFTMNLGSVSWSGCGATPSCTVTTNSNGIASVTVTPLQVGAVTLQAAWQGLTQTTSFQAVPLVRTMHVVPATVYVATGSTVSYSVAATATQQGQPAAYTSVAWSASAGPVTFSGGQTTTNAQGVARATVTVGPLAQGDVARAEACAWTTVCGNFIGIAVDPPQFVVGAPANASQTVPAAGTLLPTSIQITDGGGNPIIGAPVEIYQTVSQWTAPCPVHGRCPVAPILQASTTTVTTDGSGMATVTPLQIPGPEVTNVVITSGTAGYATLTLQKQP